jgi:hypothetical protein
MNEVIARIDVSTPTGRKIVRELENHKKTVKLEHPLPAKIAGQKTYTLEDARLMMEKKLNDYYGTNFKL